MQAHNLLTNSTHLSDFKPDFKSRNQQFKADFKILYTIWKSDKALEMALYLHNGKHVIPLLLSKLQQLCKGKKGISSSNVSIT